MQNLKCKIAIQKLKCLKTFEFILVFLTFNFLLLTFPLSVLAQTATPSAFPVSSPATYYPLPATVSPTSPLYTDLLVNNLFHSFSCLAIGQSVIGQPCLSYQVTQNAQGALQGVPVLSQVNTSGGVLGATTSLIGALYQNPPVRTVDYLASVGEGFGIVKTANAQVVGSGAAVLSPILKLWQVSRNISYVIMILVFLVIGLMVMFRNKINPQTVISAQAALPGLVIGLVMITLSYFLAGLISDIAFVGTNVVGYYFVAAQGQINSADPQWIDQRNLAKQISPESILSVFSRFVGIITNERAQDALAAIFNNFSDGVQSQIRWLAGLLAFQFSSQPGQAIPVIGQFVGPIIGLIGAAATAGDPTAILGYILAFVATFILIYQMIQLLLRLITTYLTIVFLTLTAPFQFLIAALPGRQGIATGWILNMLANILVFPAVLAVFYFVAFILGQSFGPFRVANLNQKQNSTFIPVVYAQEKNQIIGTNTFPLFGGMNLGFINVLLAFGALIALPTVPEIVIRTLGKASQAGQLIGQEISGGIRGGQGYAGRTPGLAQGAAQGLGTGIAGERTISWTPEGGAKLVTTKIGGWHILKDLRKPKTPTSGPNSSGPS
ncbi:hypothetical protein HYU95_03650 [Candidatus Daviesbacteria bacterium]|nr:hypothetical protein [Candidatus Daviesbacteria bacterium]